MGSDIAILTTLPFENSQNLEMTDFHVSAIQKWPESLVSGIFLELAALNQDGALAQHRLSLLTEMLLHGAPEPLLHDVVHARGRLRLKAAELLKAPAGAGLETLKYGPSGCSSWCQALVICFSGAGSGLTMDLSR